MAKPDCPSGKVAFASRSEATEALVTHFRKADKLRTGKMRSYECPMCGAYHITSQNERRPER